MNLKKHIKLKKEFDVEPEFTAADQARLNTLIAQMGFNAEECPPAKKKANWWQIFAPVASVAVALVITLTCVFTLRSSPELKYQDEDLINIESNFSSLQDDLKFFDLSQIEKTSINVFLTYDSKSNDRLFYSVEAQYEITTLKLTIIINENYDYDFGVIDDITQKELISYKVNYNCKCNRDNLQATYKGWINVETETVYFEYVQIPALGDEAFFETIQEIIKVK